MTFLSTGDRYNAIKRKLTIAAVNTYSTQLQSSTSSLHLNCAHHTSVSMICNVAVINRLTNKVFEGNPNA